MSMWAILIQPADYAVLLGIRRTRVGRWVWQGRTYRTRALAMRRMPRLVSIGGVLYMPSTTAPRRTRSVLSTDLDELLEGEDR